MKTVNSISGGKSSAYVAANYPADYNVFCLVRIQDPKCLWLKGKDEKTRQRKSQSGVFYFLILCLKKEKL